MAKGYLGSLTNEVDLEVIEEAYAGDYLGAPWIPVLMDEIRRLRIERNQLREIIRGILALVEDDVTCGKEGG